MPRLSFSCRLDWDLTLPLLLKRSPRKMVYFGRCLSELTQRVPLPYSQGRSNRYSNRFRNFTVTIPRCYNDAYVSSFFRSTAKLQNSLPIECFPLTYNLYDFKAKINRHLLFVGSFQKYFMHTLIILCFFFVHPCLVVVVQPCMELIPIKKIFCFKLRRLLRNTFSMINWSHITYLFKY